MGCQETALTSYGLSRCRTPRRSGIVQHCRSKCVQEPGVSSLPPSRPILKVPPILPGGQQRTTRCHCDVQATRWEGRE